MTAGGEEPRLRRWQRLLLGLALRLWPADDREAMREQVFAFVADRERARSPSGIRRLVETGLEGWDLALRGIGERRRTRHRKGGGMGRWREMPGTALRRVLRRPVASATIVGILGVGLAAGTTLFSVVNTVVLEELPYLEPERLVRIGGLREGRSGIGTVSGPNFRDLTAATTRLTGVAASTPASIAVSEGESPAELVRGAWVSGAFFDVLGREALEGRALTPDDDRPDAPLAVVLSHRFRTTRFGAGTAVGRTLRIEGRPATVVGVMPPDFHPPEALHLAETAFWVPLAHSPLPWRERGLAFLDVVGRRAGDVSPEVLAAELRAVGEGIAEANGIPERAFAGFGAVDLTLETRGDSDRTLLLLGGAVGLLLLLVTANVGGLVLLGTLDRIGELRVRVSLGATRARVIGELVAETLLLGAAGGVLGILLTRVAVDALRAGAPVDLPRLAELQLDPGVLAFATLLSIALGTVIGLLPAAPILRTLTPGASRGRTGGVARTDALMRDGLVAAQVALGLVLMIGAALLLRSLVALQTVDPGVVVADRTVISLRMDGEADAEADRALYDRILDEAAALPGVRAASLTSGAPWTPGGWTTYLEPEGVELEEGALRRARIRSHQVSPGHLEHLGLRLTAGRGFEAGDGPGSEPVIVISRSTAERWFGESAPIGRRAIVGGDGSFTSRTVVGVVETPVYGRPTAVPEEHVWLPYAQFPPASPDLVLTTAGDGPDRAALAAMIARVDPTAAIRSVRTLGAARAEVFTEPAFFTRLLGAFAAVALILAAVGLYGSVSRVVQTRGRELGIRMALGARTDRLVRSVVLRGVRVTAAGAGVGLVVGYLSVSVLESFLFGTAVGDAAAWVGASALLLLAGALASWIPARRVARVDPNASLRSE